MPVDFPVLIALIAVAVVLVAFCERYYSSFVGPKGSLIGEPFIPARFTHWLVAPRERLGREQDRGHVQVHSVYGGKIVFDETHPDFAVYAAEGATFTFEATENGRMWRWSGITPEIDREARTVTFTLSPSHALLISDINER